MPKIMIVEDDAILMKMYSKKFSTDGFEVVQAADGQEAVDKISEKPSIVLLDVMLPKIDGFGVLQKIKENSETKDIPVILSTNLGGGEADRQKAKSSGAVDYLIKSDYTPAQIVEKVKEYIK